MKVTPDYVRRPDGLYRKDAKGDTKLSNFVAEIIRDIEDEDRSERIFRIHGDVNGIQSEFEIAASEFDQMSWVTQYLGPQARILPGYMAKDYLRDAIQAISNKVQHECILRHIGWTELDGELAYVHGGGIFATTPVPKASPRTTYRIELDDTLRNFKLTTPCDSQMLRLQLQEVLDLFSLGPWYIMAPLICGVFRALLGPADFMLFLWGPSGSFKTTVATVIQQFFGRSLDDQHLPVGWNSTANRWHRRNVEDHLNRNDVVAKAPRGWPK